MHPAMPQYPESCALRTLARFPNNKGLAPFRLFQSTRQHRVRRKLAGRAHFSWVPIDNHLRDVCAVDVTEGFAAMAKFLPRKFANFAFAAFAILSLTHMGDPQRRQFPRKPSPAAVQILRQVVPLLRNGRLCPGTGACLPAEGKTLPIPVRGQRSWNFRSLHPAVASPALGSGRS